jgi:hypothetical protein
MLTVFEQWQGYILMRHPDVISEGANWLEPIVAKVVLILAKFHDCLSSHAEG